MADGVRPDGSRAGLTSLLIAPGRWRAPAAAGLRCPARIDLLEALRQCGPCSVYALAKTAGRNYSNVHTDVNKLEEHGLVKRTHDDTVFVPFESMEIHLALVKRVA